MYRPIRRPTPDYGIPPAFNAIHGEHANLRTYGVFPYCAMMQVAEEDTYTDYVICRGFDVRMRKFIDYESGNPDKLGISVAKPFGSRATGAYQIGQIFAAFLPTQTTDDDYTPPSPSNVWRVGRNPGTCPVSGPGGHPDDLDDVITELIDHNGDYVNWMMVSSGTANGARRAKIHDPPPDNEGVACGEGDDYGGVWCDIYFLDGPKTQADEDDDVVVGEEEYTFRAFYYDLELNDVLEDGDPVTVVWSDYLPEDPAAGPNGEYLQAGWLIVTWPCPDDSADMVAPLPPLVANSDFSVAFSTAFGGPTGEFSNDFNFAFDNNYYNDALLEDMETDSYLYGHWKLEDDAANTTVDDAADNYDGTLTGGDNTEDVATPNGPGGRITDSFTHDGSADYIYLPSIPEMGVLDMTVSIWIKSSASASLNGIMAKARAAAVDGRIGIYADATNIKTLFDPMSGATLTTTASMGLTGSWQHILVTFDRDGDMTLYVDGTEEDSVDISSYASDDMSIVNEWTIGQYYLFGGLPGNYTAGQFASARIFRRLLTAAEIEALYREGT